MLGKLELYRSRFHQNQSGPPKGRFLLLFYKLSAIPDFSPSGWRWAPWAENIPLASGTFSKNKGVEKSPEPRSTTPVRIPTLQTRLAGTGLDQHAAASSKRQTLNVTVLREAAGSGVDHLTWD